MKTITEKDFDRLLADIIDNDTFFLMSIPGIYRILSDYYNDDVLAAWEAQHRAEDEAPGSMNDSVTSGTVRPTPLRAIDSTQGIHPLM